jgi:hypothetical protein
MSATQRCMITDKVPIQLALDPMTKIRIDPERGCEGNQDQRRDHGQRYGYFATGGHLLGEIAAEQLALCGDVLNATAWIQETSVSNIVKCTWLKFLTHHLLRE